jgi:hypothetical protein
MALVSPGVEINIIDQSQYSPTASNSVPLILLATAQNKANAAGDAVAAATVSANANKLYQITSQRDLVNLYGNPFFYKTTNGTPIQGYELNEYGLLAAYSLLGATNSCYILRADVDLASLVGQTQRPSGAPADGSYWLDTSISNWGLFHWNAATNKFQTITPLVITDAMSTTENAPIDSIGNIGDYAVTAIPTTVAPTTYSEMFTKTADNMWVALGSKSWLASVATVTSIANPVMTYGHTFTINVSGQYEFTIPVPVSTTVEDLVNNINGTAPDVVARQDTFGRLIISSVQDDVNGYLQFTSSDTVLDDLGIEAGIHFYQASMAYGVSAQMPLWSNSQSIPRPTGSIWVKTSSTGAGVDLVVSKYSAGRATFVTQSCNLYTTDQYATYTLGLPYSNGLDISGATSIPAGTTYAQYGWGGTVNSSPIYLKSRINTGATVVTGINTSPSFALSAVLYVKVSRPGSTTLSSQYAVGMPSTGTVGASEFVTAWQASGIPNTTAAVASNGAIQLTHIYGGEIVLDDYIDGVSNGVIAEAGFDVGVTTGVWYGEFSSYNNNAAAATGGSGTSATFHVTSYGDKYAISLNSGGVDFVVGDLLTISGSILGGQAPDNSIHITVESINDYGGGVGPIVTFAYEGVAAPRYTTQLSNWVALDYVANEGAPADNPSNDSYWFHSVIDQVDIMVNKNGVWKGYKNVAFDLNGHPAATGVSSTDPAGPIISASAPTMQSDGTVLAYGDLWIDSSDLENFPVISRWQSVDAVNQWVLINTTDQVSSNGMVFADARWSTSGNVDPINDPVTSINTLLTSDNVDLDAPNPDAYPQGMLLFNTRRSGYNVKQFKANYFNGINFPNASLPEFAYAWVSASGVDSTGVAYMGRKAQRNIIVQAIKASVATNMEIREEDTFFNLISCPNFPELQAELITLNNDRNNTAYIIGDAPMRLSDQATDITNWATNASSSTATGEDGLVTRDEYMGIFYPSGVTTDLTGSDVVVPASHMMLRTFLRNDTVGYPWFAAAGTRRGIIDNATNIGYLQGNTGEFQVIKNRTAIRDVLYTNQINPLAYFTGVGLLNYGNKSSKDTSSAMDRTNVARLVAYIRNRLQIITRPFVFEPNDALTRAQLTGVVQTLFIDLVTKRGLYDYLVLCDETNNTPARIDRSELWVDIAIEPVKATEFIYIPVRIMNTGAIANLK